MKEIMNPFLPSNEYIADGEPHVFGDRVYLYGSHDQEDGDTFCMRDYTVWSAPVENLSEWVNHGVSYSPKKDPYYSEKRSYMYAPDVVKGNDGRYYLYYCLAGDRGSFGFLGPISVAVSDNPHGEFEYYGCVKNTDGTVFKEGVLFDPAVINDEGVIRLYFGFSFKIGMIDRMFRKKKTAKMISLETGHDYEKVMKNLSTSYGAYNVTLDDDMLTVKSEVNRILCRRNLGIKGLTHPFYEGSSIRKVNGKYYFIYSSARNHELCYAVSDVADSGFRYGGVIVSNGDVGYKNRKEKDRLNNTGTNHGSIECINGDWYVFYHRLTHDSDYSRQACAEKINILDDGSIPMVEITTQGLTGRKMNGICCFEAVKCCILTDGAMIHKSNGKGNKTKPCVSSRDDERFIQSISNETIVGYRYFDLSNTNTIRVQIRGKGKGVFTILDDIDGKQIGSVVIEGSDKWEWFTGEIKTHKSKSTLVLVYNGSQTIELKHIELS